MARSLVTYFDYKSPYAFVAKELIQELAAEYWCWCRGVSGIHGRRGGLEHDHIMDEAHALGVFGVPSFIVDGELYWGGEYLAALRERLGRGADA